MQTGPVRASARGLTGMVTVETIAKVRRLYFVEGKAIKAICRATGLARDTVRGIVRAGIDGPTERRYERRTQPHR